MTGKITHLVAANPGGIANRIKCLVSLWRLADKYNKKVSLYWIRNHTCGAEFNKLFENKVEVVSKEELEDDEQGIYRVFQTWRFLTLKDEVPDNFAEVHPNKRRNNIDLEFHRIPLDVRKSILFYLHQLKPTKVITSIVDKFVSENGVKNLVGVHIRRDDFVMKGNDEKTDVSSDDKFIDKMYEVLIEDMTTKFLLCTDSQETQDKFKEEFGDRIIIYPKKNRDRTTTLNTQQGLVDLLLLSKTKHIIGTYHSTFNEVAWWLGDCKAKVDIIVDKKLNKEFIEKKNKLEKSKKLKLKRYIINKTRIFKR